MRCDQVQPELLDYSRGLLSGPESSAIREHLTRCADCAAVLDEEVAFAARLEATPDSAPVNDVWALVRARTRPRRFSPTAWLRVMVATNARKATAAALATVVTAVGLYSLNTSDQPPVAKKSTVAPAAVTVKWSDDPLGKHTDAIINYIDEM